MKNVFSKSQGKMGRIRASLLALAVGVFLLQGCFCIDPAAYGARKNCNCGDKQQLAKKSKAQSESISTVPVAAATKITRNDSKIMPAINLDRPITLPEMNKPPKSEKKLPLGIKGISTSIIGGPNLSFKSSKEDYGNTDHKHSPGAGVQLGVTMSCVFSEKFAVAPALIFKSNSATETLGQTIGEPGGGDPGNEIKSKYNYSYLSVPVMAQIKVNDQLTLMAGPELNLLLGATVKTTGYGDTDKTDIKDNSVKAGAGIQAGVKYNIPNSPIGIQLIYDHRLSRLNEKTTDYYPGGGYETPAWNMKSIQLGVICELCELIKGKKK